MVKHAYPSSLKTNIWHKDRLNGKMIEEFKTPFVNINKSFLYYCFQLTAICSDKASKCHSFSIKVGDFWISNKIVAHEINLINQHNIHTFNWLYQLLNKNVKTF